AHLRSRTLSELFATVRALPGFFFFNGSATTEIYTLSLHDALPISRRLAMTQLSPVSRNCSLPAVFQSSWCTLPARRSTRSRRVSDRKSTRLNSSHVEISYAVFCLKKKTKYISWYDILHARAQLGR